jgi:hypothetical protein
MTTSTLARCIALACATTAAFSSSAKAQPDPETIYVESLSYSGSACPQGTVGLSLTGDRLTLTMIFDSFVATLGAGVPITESRKNCLVFVRLRAPEGKAWSVFGVDQRGYAQIDAGAVGVVRTDIADLSKTVTTETHFAGPVSRDYLNHTDVGVGLNGFACGRTAMLLVHSQVELFSSNPEAAASLSLDSIDGRLMEGRPQSDVTLRLTPCGPLNGSSESTAELDYVANTVREISNAVAVAASQSSVDALTTTTNTGLAALNASIVSLTAGMPTAASIATLQATVSNLEPELVSKASQDSVDALTQRSMRVAIERALGDGSKTLLFMLPASAGGQLEQVHDVVRDVLLSAHLAGFDVTKANNDFVKGEAAETIFDYRNAYGWYMSAYQRLQK